VASENDTRTGTLIVESDSPATFGVTDLTPADTTVATNGTVDVSATVTNDGDGAATQQVRMQVDGSTVARRSLTLDGGASTTVSFTDVGTGGLGPGTYSYGVASNDDSATGTLTVEDDGSEPTATFTLSPLEPATTTVSRGSSVTVTTTVTNGGAAEGTQTVRLERNGQQVDTADVSLAAGEGRTVTLSFGTSELSNGSHVYSVSTDDDGQVGTLTVTTDSETTPTGPATTPTPEPPDGTSTPVDGTATETTAASGTTSTTTAGGADGGGGLLPSGLLGTLLLWVGVPLLVVYGILKALAIYLGY